jgi:catechol 2,3-dioxygenase-like lactoylglutathione lyase family enzyme
MVELRGLRHVALTVRDVDVSADWYRTVLGFEERFREDDGRRAACIMDHPNGFGVAVVAHGGSSGAAFDPHVTGLDHVGFAVGSRDELVAWEEHLRAAGVDQSGVIDTPFGGILNFKDPDGIALALFWER